MAFDTANIPRPGLALGPYPERDSIEGSRIDHLFAQVTSRFYSQWHYREKQVRRIIESIDKAGRPLIELSDQALLDFVSDLRPQLVKSGWRDELAIKSFAAVREMADRTLGMRHFECQLLGGWVMYQGALAEMPTGEGKTLTATLPAATVAMSGVPVHIITTNEYLAVRDANAMRPLFEKLGLTVGIINEAMDIEARRTAYACDITYCTNKQIAFDYLRDRVARGTNISKMHLNLEYLNDADSGCRHLMLRGLCYAIVDEADSVLIDEARTPLVLSRALNGDDTMSGTYLQAIDLARTLKCNTDFKIDESLCDVSITHHGSAHLAKTASRISPFWQAAVQREELVVLALSALHLYQKDREYVVYDNKVHIVDSNTGRVMADRTWEAGLQQMIECKEHCQPRAQTETLARISYQCFYSHYLKLAGMTGTANEIERELADIYGLNVVRIRPHRPSRRIAMAERVYLRAEDACAAIIASTRAHSASGRPVLIGTRSVLKSEQIAERLAAVGMSAQVLNARQDADEANIIAQAGKAGQITVATNMAGRGTDILLGNGVNIKGGLHVIVTERNDSARIDRQLIGRCARQGDPGSYQCFSSFEDDIPKQYCSKQILSALAVLGFGKSVDIPVWLGSWLLNRAQRQHEHHLKKVRRQVQNHNRKINVVLSFTGAVP